MPTDPVLKAKRDAAIRADFNRLTSEELPVNFKGTRVFVRPNYNQAIAILGQLFFLSPRTIEPILTATASQLAPLKTGSTDGYSQALSAVEASQEASK